MGKVRQITRPDPVSALAQVAQGLFFDGIDIVLGYQGLPTATSLEYIFNYRGTNIVAHSLGTLDASNLAGFGLTGSVEVNALPVFNIAPGGVGVRTNVGDFVTGFGLSSAFNPGAESFFVSPTFKNSLGHGAIDVYGIF